MITDHENMHVAVLGVGGVGGTIAAILVSQGVDVTCIARNPGAEILRKQGLQLDSVMFGSLHTYPKVSLELQTPVDLLFVTTKAPDLDEALSTISPKYLKEALVIPLLNGIEHMTLLRGRLGSRVVAGSIRVEAKKVAANRIVHSSPFFLIRTATDSHNLVPPLEKVAFFLNKHRLKTQIDSNEAGVLFEKLARLASVACLTALTNKPLGFVKNDPELFSMLKTALREGVTISNKMGVSMTFDEQWKIVESMPDSLTTSLQRDIAIGHPSELDSIAGALIRAAHRKDVACPVLERLVHRIKTERIGINE